MNTNVTSTFNAQDVANTLWAYAMMERAPGAALMRVLEERAEALASTFNKKEVANTRWARAKIGRELGEPVMRVLVWRSGRMRRRARSRRRKW